MPDAAARPQAPGFHRFRIGAFEAIALHDGTLQRDRPSGFIRNAEDAAVAEAFAVAGMPADKLTLTFTALLIDTGEQLVLIDTGFGENGPPSAGRLLANLAAAGIMPEDIGTLLISHFHGDHISGMRTKADAPVFPNAKVVVPKVEWDYWMDDARAAAAPEGLKPNFALVRRMLGPVAAEIRQIAWGEEVLPGITAVQANGHTPGMTGFEIASAGESLLFVADITNNPLIFVRHPDWQAMFDMDPEQSIRTRRTILDRAADEKLRLFFFHAPFPGVGHVVRNAEAYEYLPALWV